MKSRTLTSLAAALAVAVCASLVAACGSDPNGDPAGEPDAGAAPLPDGALAPTPDGGGPLPDGAPPPPAPCGAAKYSETLPTNTADLSGVAFSAANPSPYVLSVLERRYPLGKWLVEGGLANTAIGGSCIDRFLGDKSSGDAVIRQLSTVVHECGHFFDLTDRGPSSSTYNVRTDVIFKCSQGDAQGRGGVTFARSRITKDAYAAKRPACGGQSRPGCDTYADVYLDGNPDDTTFQGGDQGFSSVLEETTQYVNSLATAYAFEDRYRSRKVSERDGILTFQWYVERYLLLAKASYPAAYKLIREDACWRKAVLTVWDRADFYLEATKSLPSLGINDAAILALVNDPVLKAEIDALRALECK